MRSTNRPFRPRAHAWLALPLGVVAMISEACSGNSTALTATTTTLPRTSTSVPASTTSTTAVAQKSYPLYFIRGNQLGVSVRLATSTTDAHYTATVNLLTGPDPVESAAGLATDIPAGTTVRGLQIKNGIATVNLSPQFVTIGPNDSLAGRLAQVVYTLTSTPTVTQVVIEIAGTRIVNFAGVDLTNPVGRSQVTAALPLVLLELPGVGGSLKSKLTITGLTSGAGTYDVQLLDPSGKLLATATNSAVPGGTFTQSVPFTISGPETGTVRMFGRPSSSSQPVQSFQFTLPIAP
jgi:spore germination protein GerM